MILSTFELDAKLVSKIKAYQSKDGLQNVKGLEKYIDKILTDFNIFLRIIISIILGGLGILVFFNLFTKPQQIKDMEELFDKNSGFLWSNEQY
mgnify:CR=1 FL=1